MASIPFAAYRHLPAEALADKVVIDTMNYYPERDGEMGEVTTATVATSESDASRSGAKLTFVPKRPVLIAAHSGSPLARSR